ncbi:hypothetical protein N9N03_01940 [Chlamydiia bacterium]|nr:hypothetical protein [Chlamydiia bacterium]
MAKDQHQQHQEWQACFTDVTEFEQSLLDHDPNTAGRYRNKQQALSLAQYLLHENGTIDTNRLLLVKTFLQHHLYPIDESLAIERLTRDHMITVCELLQDGDMQDLWGQLLSSWPHPSFKEVMKQVSMTKYHSEKFGIALMVLSAWLMQVRQTVGSCFATAPAILIHRTQPERFLSDMIQMVQKGAIKRVVDGTEHIVPLSVSTGSGDLTRILSVTKRELTDIRLIHALESCDILKSYKKLSQSIDAFTKRYERLIDTMISDYKHVHITVEQWLTLILQTENGIADISHKNTINPKKSSSDDLDIKSIDPKQTKYHLYTQQLTRVKGVYAMLIEHPLIKSWEYTLASFSETESKLCLWNLFTTLGMNDHRDDGSFAQCLHQLLQQKVDHCQQEAQLCHDKYTTLFQHAQTIKSRLNNVDTKKDAQWVSMQYQSQKGEAQHWLTQRDSYRRKAKIFSDIYQWLIQYLIDAVKHYFQEVYDPSLSSDKRDYHDDHAAGFRLVYKINATATSTWTPIHTQDEFIDAIARFLGMIEHELQHEEALQFVKREFQGIMTSLIQFIRGDHFISTAVQRLDCESKDSASHYDKRHFDQITQKPWAFTSGGTMDGFLKNYYRLREAPSKSTTWVDSVTDLWVFFIDTLRHLPRWKQDVFIEDPKKGMLMHSPTHACLLLPGVKPFVDSWLTDDYPYTWIRDHYCEPSASFYATIRLNTAQQLFLLDLWVVEFPYISPKQIHKWVTNHLMNPYTFRDHIRAELNQLRIPNAQSAILLSRLDSILFKHLPFVNNKQYKEIQLYINKQMNRLGCQLVPQSLESIMSIGQCHETISRMLVKAVGSRYTHDDLMRLMKAAFRAAGCWSPTPVRFADTNWTHYDFAFCWNPGTDKLEIWAIHPYTRNGYSMTSWEKYTNGQVREAMWGVYNDPTQYSLY